MEAFLKLVRNIPQARNLTKLKLGLLLSFIVLLLFQFIVGFREFEDYLIIFIFILFLNDLYYKLTKPQPLVFHEERMTRLIMSGVFLFLLVLPFAIDSMNVSNTTRLTISKLGFVLWAQVFLLDSFFQYKQTHSKQWLVFANAAVILIIIGAFVN
jgi:hypothetical protein